MKGAYRWRLKHNFNPRAPCGARPASTAGTIGEVTFQSTRPVRGATHIKIGVSPSVTISIHAPRAGRDGIDEGTDQKTYLFQSTRPVRGATQTGGTTPPALEISIHAPRAGRDKRGGIPEADEGCISIHAPRAGRDHADPGRSGQDRNFNPRAPCGARLGNVRCAVDGNEFQSTRPVRGATEAMTGEKAVLLFQSTRPVRGATRSQNAVDLRSGISIHAPRAGRDPESICASG